jgi:dTDP-glucose pyrophosphorylase
MSQQELVGVILAAGKGSRLLPFSTRYPKPILPICNKPIVEYQIEHMVALGIRKVIIVVGHLGYEISKVLGDGERLGVQIRYVEQTEILGIAHAVAVLEPLVDSPFVLFLGDIFFDTRDLSEMVQKLHDNEAAAVLAVKEEPDPAAVQRNFAVIADEHGFVTRVIEKPRHSRSTLKGCGLYLFDQTIFDAIRRTPRTAMRNEYEITDSIQILIEDGYRVVVSSVVLQDINVTFPHDLLDCNLLQLRKQNKANLIAASAQINPGATLENSVIGERASIVNPIRVVDSLILEGSSLHARADVERAIIMPDAIVDCRGMRSTFALQAG